jgi:hypothetical protein
MQFSRKFSLPLQQLRNRCGDRKFGDGLDIRPAWIAQLDVCEYMAHLNAPDHRALSFSHVS